MVGTKGHSGGPRPGSGRKTDAIREMQQGNRRTVLSVVSREDLEAIGRAMIEKAKMGDEKAFRAFMAYVLGNPDTEVTVKGDADAPLVVEVVYLDQATAEDDDD